MSDDKPKLERPILETLRRLLDFVVPYRKRVIAVLVLMLFTSASSLIAPVLVRQAINLGLEQRDRNALALYSFVFLGMKVLEGVSLRFQLFNMIWTGQHAIMDVRQGLFYKYLDLNLAYFDHNRVGDLMSRVTEDSNSLQNFITWAVVGTINNTFTLIGIIVLMLVYDWSLALLTFTILPPMIGLTWWWRKRSSKRYREVRKAVGVVSASLQENLAGMRIIQAFVREYREKARFGSVATDELTASLKADRLASIYLPGIDVISQVGVAIVLSVGGLRVLDGDMSAGTLVAFLMYLDMFFNPIRDLAMRLDQFQEAAAAGERIITVLEAQPEILDRPGAQPLANVRGAVELRSVSFFYTRPETTFSDAPAESGSGSGSETKQPASDPQAGAEADSGEKQTHVLHDIDLVVEPGQTVALVGHTGAGKSTLVRLLGRFYEPQNGQILFDGTDIASVTMQSLRDQMAWVPQDTGLFATTIAENLR
ncbi:MAG: ABC transporter ATP-binding protein, partial [Anaerolineae bacterium]|nr:ABC transporter ATP-binding protein [Anaerolineae bacterium]